MFNVFDLCFNKNDGRLGLIVNKAIESFPPRYFVGHSDTYNPAAYYEYMCHNFNMNLLLEEHLYIIAFDEFGEPLGVFEMSHGSTSETCVDRQGIMERILLIGARFFVIFHNHPRCYADSIKNLNLIDEMTTRDVVRMGLIMGTPCLDHIIIGTDDYLSIGDETPVFQEEWEAFAKANNIECTEEE